MTSAPQETFLASEKSDTKTPEPFTLVVFGASGDLTRRKLMPAIFQLWCQGTLSPASSVLGFARSEKTDESFRRELKESIGEFFVCRGQAVDDDTYRRFASRVFYQRGAYDCAEDFTALRQRLEAIAADEAVAGNCVYYLATAPTVIAPILEMLGRAGLAGRDRQSPWTKIVIEKPFGCDLQSARELNAHARSVFDENQIFRIDHYLGKETVQNIMVLRFANSIFEHLWSHDNIDHVQITVAESMGVGGRGAYYDTAGALRDIVQNHMMHLLCLIAMEPPVSLTADATPCLARGSDAMMALVAGVIASAAPAPMMSVARMNSHTPLSLPSVANALNPTAEIARPAPPTRRWP